MNDKRYNHFCDYCDYIWRCRKGHPCNKYKSEVKSKSNKTKVKNRRRKDDKRLY